MAKKLKLPEVDVVVVVQQLWSGDWYAFPAAAPERGTYGASEEDVLDEMRLFLELLLGELSAADLHRFTVAPDVALESATIAVPRDDLPKKISRVPPIELSCLKVPAGDRAAWIVVFALQHTFFAEDGSRWQELAEDEIVRVAAVREMTPREYLQILPGQESRVERLRITVEAPSEEDAEKRERRKSHHRAQKARKLLDEIGAPLERSHPDKQFPLVGRDREADALRSLLLGKERLAVVLAGKAQVGKTILAERVLEKRSDVYVTSGARLMAGQSYLGQWQERLHEVMKAAETLDAVLYFDNLADLFAQRDGSDDIAGLIRPYLEDRRVRLVGELHPDTLEEATLRHVGFFSHLHQVALKPLDAATTRRIVDERAARQRRRRDAPGLLAEAVNPLVELAARYLPYREFPGKAVRLYEEILAAHAHDVDVEGQPKPIGVSQVFAAVSRRTGIPEFLLRDDRALKLERIMIAFRRRIVGQEAAVKSVAETLCTVKAGLQPSGRPLAVFLFVGPTGVGKTEIARTLADFLFGSEDRLLRFDMSEYMDAWAAERLIRGSAGTGGEDGLLTRAIRAQPFSVVLLDEIEKASPAVFDLLLQVLGEGRLSDAKGRTAFFHNAIVIMTSNLGAAHRRDRPGFAADEKPQDDAAYYTEQVDKHFRPELVNRLDRVIPFAALRPEEVEEIARLAVQRIGERHGLAERGLRLDVADSVVTAMARGAHDAAYGARQLHRHLDENLVAPMARLLGRLPASDPGSQGGELVSGSVLEVLLPDDAAGKTLEREGELAFVIRRGERRHGAGRALDRITATRRTVTRWMANERLIEIRDEIESLTAQLARHRRHGQKGRKKKEATPSSEIVRMQIDLHRLQEIWDRLHAAQRETEEIEEIAVSGYFEGEAADPFLEPLDDALRGFRQTLPSALVASEPQRDEIALVVTECDDERALDLWLTPLFEHAGQRDWVVCGHFPVGRSHWESKPKKTKEIREILDKPERRSARLLLRVRGPNAGIFLAAEAGFHLFHQPPDREDDTFLRVERLIFRDKLGPKDLELAKACLGPRPVLHKKAVKPVRAYDFSIRRLEIGPGRFLELPFDEYWPRFDEIVLEHLIPFEEDPRRDRDHELLSTVIGEESDDE